MPSATRNQRGNASLGSARDFDGILHRRHRTMATALTPRPSPASSSALPASSPHHRRQHHHFTLPMSPSRRASSSATSVLTVGLSSVPSGSRTWSPDTRDAAGNIEPAGLSVAFGLAPARSPACSAGHRPRQRTTPSFSTLPHGHAADHPAPSAAIPITPASHILVVSATSACSQSTLTIVPGSSSRGSTARSP